MKKKAKLEVSKKVVKNLKLKLKKMNDRKAAPLYYADFSSDDSYDFAPSNGSSC
jgi:hypothetical protein